MKTSKQRKHPLNSLSNLNQSLGDFVNREHGHLKNLLWGAQQQFVSEPDLH